MMTNATQLFFSRLKKGWLFQYQVWRTAVDWTVWIYILIPVMIISLYQYRSLYDKQLKWVELIPIESTFLVLFWLCWTGMVRLFIENGDLLFLRQNQNWLSRLMKLGIAYSVMKNIVFIGFILAIFYPVWTFYHSLSTNDIFLIAVFAFVFRLCIQFIRQILSVSFQGWKLLLVNLIFFLITFVVAILFYFSDIFYQTIFIISLSISLYFLYNVRMRMKWSFFDDCLREQQQKLKLTSLLIGVSGFKVEKSIFKRKKPFIFFPNSMRMFEERTNSNIMAEIFLKFLFRNKSRLWMIFQVSGVFTYALVIAPFWIKWILLIICILSVIHIVKSGWGELSKHSFFKLYTFQKRDEAHSAVKRAISYITLPFCFVFGYTVGVTNFSIFLGFIVGILSCGFAYYYIKKELWLE